VSAGLPETLNLLLGFTTTRQTAMNRADNTVIRFFQDPDINNVIFTTIVASL
jgi:hypothetical protein